MRHSSWVLLPVAAISTSIYATTYFSTEQAQQAIFPGAHLVQSFVTLNAAQKAAIESHSGIQVTDPLVHAWKVPGGGWFFIDQVLGKHEMITYALGLNADGSVKQVEIMDYRENHGYEVRNAAWRNQFVGKTAASPLKLDQDIKNISGATLSSKHVTDGIKRLLATYEVALRGH